MAKAWKATNQDRVRLCRRARLCRRYGITLERYAAMLAAQGGRCYICREPEMRVHARSGQPFELAIDHDHACCPGKSSCGRCVRHLLCSMCNSAVGLLELRGPDVMTRLIGYVRH